MAPGHGVNNTIAFIIHLTTRRDGYNKFVKSFRITSYLLKNYAKTIKERNGY